MAKGTSVNTKSSKPRKKLGRHSKKQSKNKRSKNYKKPYNGQGK